MVLYVAGIYLTGVDANETDDTAATEDPKEATRARVERMGLGDASPRAVPSGADNDGTNRASSEGGEQSRGLTFEATGYTAFCSTGCTGVTATGIDVSRTIMHEGRRVVAVDPKVLPLGTKLRITTKSGRVIKAVAADTGGAINGSRVDILFKTKEQANQFGRQDVKVEIIE